MDTYFDDNQYPPKGDNFQTMSLWPERLMYEQFLENPLSHFNRVRAIGGKAVVIESGGNDLAVVISVEELRKVMQELRELSQMRLHRAQLMELDYYKAETWGELFGDWKAWPRRLKEFLLRVPARNPHPLTLPVRTEPDAAYEWQWRTDDC